MTKLQYQESGRWFDCGERTEEFLNKAVATDYRGIDKDAAIKMLEAGETLHIGQGWSDRIRNKPEQKQCTPVEMFIPDNNSWGY